MKSLSLADIVSIATASSAILVTVIGAAWKVSYSIHAVQVGLKEDIHGIDKKIDAVQAGLREDIHGIDKKIDAVQADLNTKIDAVQAGLNTKIDAVQASLNTKIDAVQAGLNTRIDAVQAGLKEDIHSLDIKISEIRGELKSGFLGPLRQVIYLAIKKQLSSNLIPENQHTDSPAVEELNLEQPAD